MGWYGNTYMYGKLSNKIKISKVTKNLLKFKVHVVLVLFEVHSVKGKFIY